jgi:uncharacterized protein
MPMHKGSQDAWHGPCVSGRVTATTELPVVVLDTNVVLDWLLFRHPDGAAIESQLAGGRLRWVATPAMRDELAQVLARGHLDAWHPDPPKLWAAWHRYCHEVVETAPAGPASNPRCTDPDDQKFIDLALACGARWLLSRDRAVLKLARRLRERGVQVIAPGAWAASMAASPPDLDAAGSD